MKYIETDQDRFVRIAMARLRKYYPYYPQRIAIAAQMYRKWKSRQCGSHSSPPYKV